MATIYQNTLNSSAKIQNNVRLSYVYNSNSKSGSVKYKTTSHATSYNFISKDKGQGVIFILKGNANSNKQMKKLYRDSVLAVDGIYLTECGKCSARQTLCNWIKEKVSVRWYKDWIKNEYTIVYLGWGASEDLTSSNSSKSKTYIFSSYSCNTKDLKALKRDNKMKVGSSEFQVCGTGTYAEGFFEDCFYSNGSTYPFLTFTDGNTATTKSWIAFKPGVTAASTSEIQSTASTTIAQQIAKGTSTKKIIGPVTYDDLTATLESDGNYYGLTVAELVDPDSSGNCCHYTIVDFAALMAGETGGSSSGDSGSSDASSGVSSWPDASGTSTLKQDVDLMTNQSFAEVTYLSAFNNYNLYFVPCKDSRTTSGTKDVFTSRPQLKLQNSDSTISEFNVTGAAKGVKYYKTSNNTIYSVVPRDKIPNGATVDYTATEPLTQTYSADAEIYELAKDIDDYIHYSFGSGSYIWSLDGEDYLPGMENSKTKLSGQYYGHADKRMPVTIPLLVEEDTYNSYLESDEKDYKKVLLHCIKSGKAYSLTDYFDMSDEEKRENNIICKYFDLTLDSSAYDTLNNRTWNNKYSRYDEAVNVNLSVLESFDEFVNLISAGMRMSWRKGYSTTSYIEQERGTFNLYSIELFEAYTRGHDFIQDDYTTVRAAERDPDNDSENSKVMSFDENYFIYKYSGRDVDVFNGKTKDQVFNLDGIYCAMIHEKDLLTETDVTLGETYGKQDYFIQAIKYPELKADSGSQTGYTETGNYLYKDTFKVTDYVDAIDSTKYVEDDIEIVTATIDLTQCQYYNPAKATYENGWCDCCYGGTTYDKECIYQKTGECPYRFTSEKHPRRIRTLEQSKSNRFNLVQELSKVFEYYPTFYIEYNDNGKVKLNDDGTMKKHIFFITEKGTDKYAGFRYEKNLSSVSRTVDSSSFTTKLYVENVDSSLSDTGLCTIQTAIDNLGKNSYILDFSYYTKNNLLNAEQVQRDIYGIEDGDMAFLSRIDVYNERYDEYSNLITTMTNEEMSTIQASIEVDTTGITSALEELKNISQNMYQFKVQNNKISSITSQSEVDYTTSDTYKNYLIKYKEQAVILWGLVEELFFSGDYFTGYIRRDGELLNKVFNWSTFKGFKEMQAMVTKYKNLYCKGEMFWRLMIDGFTDPDTNQEEDYTPPFSNWNNFKENIVDKYLYHTNGILGQYKSLLNQVKYWKTERQKMLNKINDLSEEFYEKYEPYIKEGTWTDSNYLTDNEYYWAGVSVLDDSCEPKISYDISVIDISPIEEYADDYTFELADTTYIEDIDFFGINEKTGLPNREKVIISKISYDLDQPSSNSITVQNYDTSFTDLFQSITASVQSLTYNENTYKRSSNFTAKQYVQTDSLQGTLSQGDLTLIDSNNSNIVTDDSGTQGKGITNNASQYKLTGEGLYFSTDGGTTWDVGVGPEGINADYIKFGQVDASKIQIVDGSYIYFLWDKDGINAYRDPSTSTSGLVDFARFNKYGLSLIENNHVRLRAGYEYRSTTSGENPTGLYSSEMPLSDQNVGFYLYNDTGKPIFKTETQSEYNSDTEDYSARISLKGEMYITNANLDGENTGNVISAKRGVQVNTAYVFEDKVVGKLNSKKMTNFCNKIHGQKIGYSFALTEGGESGGESDGISIVGNDLKITAEELKKLDEYYAGDSESGGEHLTKTINVYEITNKSECSYNYIVNENNQLCKVLNKENNQRYTVKIISVIFAEINYETTTITIGSATATNVKTLSYEYGNTSCNVHEDGNSGIYIEEKTVKLLTDIAADAYCASTSMTVTNKPLNYYDIASPASAAGTYDLSTDVFYYYEGTYGDTKYYYWASYGQSDEIFEETTDFTTDQVGIFINNKITVADTDEDTTEQTEDTTASEEDETTTEGDEETTSLGIVGASTEYLVADVSVYQGTIDWDAFCEDTVPGKTSGISGVIIRAGVRGYEGGTISQDKNLITNLQGAINKNLKIGVYFFSQAITVEEAETEAEKVNEWIKSYKQYITLPVYIDTEWANINSTGRADKLDKSTRTSVVLAFLKKIKSLGYIPGIYASTSWFSDYLNDSQLTNYSHWVAQYSSSCTYTGTIDGWQYTSECVMDGIPGDKNTVDMSIFYKDFSSEHTSSTTITETTLTNPFDLGKGKFYFAGDSLTGCLKSSSHKYADRFITLGNMQITKDGLIWSDEERSNIMNCSEVAISLGTNGCSSLNTKDKIVTAYREFLSDITKGLKTSQNLLQDGACAKGGHLYICTTLGMSDAACFSSGGSIIKSITNFNSCLKEAVEELQEEYDFIVFVDVYDATKPYQSGSNIHDRTADKTIDALYNCFSGLKVSSTTSIDGSTVVPGLESATNLSEKLTDLNKGSERLFMIASAGTSSDTNSKVYRNILSVLKNGALYMGGTINDEYQKSLDIDNFGYIPDKVSISKPALIMTNDGTIFCNWDKFFNFNPETNEYTNESLYNILKNGVSGSSSSSSSSDSSSSSSSSAATGLAEGYYLVDPLS